MQHTKSNIYITKEEAILAMRSGRNKEESEWAIKSVPATKVKRSLKITPTYLRGAAEEEICPHCRKKVELYYLSRDVPKVCYCFWCGGAIYRKRGLTKNNPMFDYSILTPEQVKEWGMELYVDRYKD